jgi:putative tricarboxylic transport membrane protein
MMVAPALARFALRFGPPEYFALAFLGLLTLSRLTGKSPLKSYTVMLLGMAIATVGIDSVSGFARFTGGSSALLEGIDFIPVIMGLYGIGEVFASVKKIGVSPRITLFRTRDLIPTRKDIKDSVGPILRGGLMGFFLGLIPGPSAIISTFGSYTLERKLSKRPEEFGKGAIEGVAGPEAANNGASSGAFVPLLSLGIPFSPVPAVLLAAFMIHGILPGPLLIRDHPNIFWGLIASMYVGNIMLLVLNLPLVGIFARVALIPNRIIMPTIIAFCFIGAFAVRNSIYDLFLLLIFGIIGFFFRLQDYDPAPLVLGMIIGPMLEEAFRESMVIFGGDVFQFFLRPLSGVMIGISIFVIISLFLSQFIKIFGIVFQRIDKRKAS